jgi:hypothetical protein
MKKGHQYCVSTHHIAVCYIQNPAGRGTFPVDGHWANGNVLSGDSLSGLIRMPGTGATIAAAG